MADETSQEKNPQAEKRCTCPSLINGHLPNCPFLKNGPKVEEFWDDDAEFESDFDFGYDEHGDDKYLQKDDDEKFEQDHGN
jgi:hypothetical protein